MAFDYNPSPNPTIAGTSQFGNLEIGFPLVGFVATGLEWQRMKNFLLYSEYIQESQRGTLYSDDNPRDTIKDLHYGSGKESEESVKKLENLYKKGRITHQRAVATANTMHNRAKHHANPNVGIKAGEKVWKEYLERLKKRTKTLNEGILSFGEFITEKKGPCWPGYKQVGLKKKGGKMVPNCVPTGKK